MTLLMATLIENFERQEKAFDKYDGRHIEGQMAEALCHLEIRIEEDMASVNNLDLLPETVAYAMRELAYFTTWMNLRQLRGKPVGVKV